MDCIMKAWYNFYDVKLVDDTRYKIQETLFYVGLCTETLAQ